MTGRARLPEVAAVFLRLGFTAFGGPAAHVALMEAEVVRRRRWVTPERFLDMFGAASLIPGPSSSELAVFLGYEYAGFLGLVVAGLCFVLPAALMSAGLAIAYLRYGSIPSVGHALAGIQPVVVAILVQAIAALAPKALPSRRAIAIAAVSSLAFACRVDAIVVLLGAGMLSMSTAPRAADGDGLSLSALVPPLLTTTKVVASVGLGALFLVFLKLGATVFGSGYVLVAFLREELVHRRGWIDEPLLLDAIAVGQITPGPVFTTATFLGYLLGRGPGAVAATVAVFLPGFILIAAIRPILAWVRKSWRAGAFLDGVNAGSIALMAVATAQLARAVLGSTVAIAIVGVSVLVLLRTKVNATWLVVAGGVIGAMVGPGSQH
ncbi:MAG: chromate efflux transporter [Polyangiales bacterium]